jgi:hypothetical protein
LELHSLAIKKHSILGMPPVGNGHAPDFNGNTRKEKTSNYLGNTRDNHFLRHHQHCCIPVCFTNTQHSPNVVDRFADEEGRCRLDFPFNGTQKSFGGKRSPQSPGNLVKKNEEDIGVPTLAGQASRCGQGVVGVQRDKRAK